MPTGSGKTWLAKHAIDCTLRSAFRAIYLAPTRALASELYEKWGADDPAGTIGIFTGDFGTPERPYPLEFDAARLLIMTPERLDACVRHWRQHWNWLPEVDLVVADEIHLLGDATRGPRLEGTLSRLRRLNPFLRVIGLSATLGNLEQLADWLDGVEYRSAWRPVPLAWRTVFFRKPDEKPDLLAKEVARVARHGGKTLVFAQSRRRAEMLSAHLRCHGHRAAHHHAGLDHEERKAVERSFRASDTDVLVATATLEVGLNLPVRQVVLYDLQAFDGEEFRPLSTVSVWQRVGRAGRPGLDTEGEAVLFAASWDRHVKNYANGDFEPCVSLLSDLRALSEQIVVEIGSGLARNKTELRAAFGGSLAIRQGRLPALGPVVDELCAAGILVESARTEEGEKEVRLKPTRLGRIAVRQMLHPTSVLVFRDFLTRKPNMTRFDLLLLVACSIDAEPVLPVTFEELSELSNSLARETSYLLHEPIDDLCRELRVTKRRFLGGLKGALALRSWTLSGDREIVAIDFGCYPSEIRRLVESAIRILPAMNAVVQMVDLDEAEPLAGNSDLKTIQVRLDSLSAMVAGGIDETAATLTMVQGIGPAWAKKLTSNGICDLEDLVQARPEDLSALGRLSAARATAWIEEATKLIGTDNYLSTREIAPTVNLRAGLAGFSLDPYRLRRSLALRVESLDATSFQISGGLDPHIVTARGSAWICDCADHAKGNVCKHVLAARRTTGDQEVTNALRALEASQKSAGLDLSKLWLAR
jgi:helicase